MLPLILSVGQAVYGAYSKNQDRKNQIAGLRKLAEVTPSERAYEKRRQDIIKSGDPLINEAGRKGVQTIRQQGQFNRQRAQGQAISQGLENSIVAQELRRKVDKDVLRAVAEQARKMALLNARAKRGAENDLERYQMGIDSRQRGIDSQILGIGGFDKMGALAGIAMAGAGGFGGDGGFDIEDVTQTQVNLMSNSDYETYLDDFFQ